MKVSFECRITYRRNPLFKRLGAVFAVLSMCTSLLWGADFYFRGTGTWDTASSWSDSEGTLLDRVPGSSDTVHIVNSAECTLSSDVTVAALDVVGILKLSGATLTVSGEVTADGSSSLVVDNGKLNFTGDGAVVIPSAVFKNNVSLFGKNLSFSSLTYDSKPNVTIGNGTAWSEGTVTIPGGILGKLTLEPNSILFNPTGALTVDSFVADTSMKNLDLNGKDLTVNGSYTNNIEISNAGNITVVGNFINNNAFVSSGTILVMGNLTNSCQSYQSFSGTSITVQGSVLSNSGKIASTGAVTVTGNVNSAEEISGNSITINGNLIQTSGQIKGTASISVTGTAEVNGTVSAPVISSGDMTVEESGTLSGFNTLDVAGDMHTAGTFNYNSGAQVTVIGGFYNTGSIDSWSTLYLKAYGFENTGTVKLLGNESTITVSRYLGDHSSSESVYPKLVLDPGEQITLAAGSARVENVTTTSGADEKLVTVFSGNFGTFIYDGINGGTFEVVEDTEGWFSNTGSPHFDNLQVTNASNGVFNITATPEIDNLVLSGKDTEHLLTVKGNGTISTSVTGISTGSNLSFDTTTPNLESGQILVSESGGTLPENWFDASTTFVWTGNSYVSGAWDIAENWYGSNRPNRNDGTGIIIINKGRFAPETLPYFGFDSISLKSLVINEGVIFDVGPNNLTLQGNLENEGTFKTSGNLYFDGNTDHSIKNSISMEGFLEVKAGSTLTVGSGVDISVGGFRNAGYVSHSGTLNVSGNFSDSGYAGEPKSSYEKIVLKGTGSFSVTTESILNTIEIAESAVVTTASDILTDRFMNSGSFSSTGSLTTTGDFINNGYVSHSGTLNVSGNFSDSGYAGEIKSSYAEVVIRNLAAEITGSESKENAASVSKLTVLRSNGVASAEFRNCLNVSDFDIKGTSDSELIEVSGNGIFYVPDSFDKVAANYVKFSEGLGVYKKSVDVNSFEGLYVIAKNAAGDLPSGWINGDRSFIWTGGTDSIWTKPSNWAGENVPAGDTAEVIVKESSHNPEITSNVLLNKITLEGNAELNVASKSLTLYSDTVLDGRIKALNGTIYITNKENDSTKVISLTLSNEQNIKDLFIAGFVNCEVTSETSGIGTLHIQDEKNIQKIDFKVSFSGEKLLAAYADITRSSVIDDVRGTLEIKNEIEIATEFKTHSGSIVSIPSGGKLITPSYIHSASNAKPETYVSVAGELSADSINLVGNNNESGSQLQVSETGTVNTRKVIVLKSYSNGNLTVPVLNEGIINITGTITDDGLETPDYGGSGKIVLGNAGQIKNNSDKNDKNIIIADLELKNIPAAIIDSGNANITVTSLSVNDVTEGTSSLSVKGVSGSSTIGIDGFTGKLKDFTLDSGTARLGSSLVIAGDFLTKVSTTVSGSGGVTVGGAFENNGTYNGTGHISCSGKFTNNGTINSGFALSAGGDFVDAGTWNTPGTITFNGTSDQNVKFKNGTIYSTVLSESVNTAVVLGTDLNCSSLTIKENSTFDSNGKNIVLSEGLNISGTFLGKGGTHEIGSDVNIKGTVNGGSSTISLGGNWTLESSATFEAETGTVQFTGTESHSVKGENTFNNFVCETAGAHLLFEEGKTQIVNGDMIIKGTSGTGNLVTLDVASEESSGKWNLDADPSKLDFYYVNIKNSYSKNNIPGSKNLKRDYHCENGGNNTRWFSETKVYWFGSTGADKTNWNQKLNWKADEEGANEVLAVPDYSDSELEVYIVKTENSYPVLEAPVNIKKLSINNDAEFHMNGNNLVAVDFENKGIFNLSGGKLSVEGTGASYSNEGKMISQGSETISVPESSTNENGTWEYTGGSLKNIVHLSFRNILISEDVLLGTNINVTESFEIAEGKTLTLGAFNLTTGSISNKGAVLINGAGRPDKNDLEKGLVKYSGSQTIKDFGGNDYFNLEISDSVVLESSISIAGKLTLDDGVILNTGNNNLSFVSYSGENEKIVINGGKISSSSETPLSVNEIEISSSAELDINAVISSVICKSNPEITVSSGKNVFLPGISAGDLIVNGILSLSGDSSFESVLISSEGKLEGPSNGIISIAGNWKDQNVSGGFVHNSGEVQITEDSVIEGKSAFYNLYGRNLGGKTISIADGSEISVSNEVYFSGSSGTSLLTLSGTGKIKVPENYALESGKFINFSGDGPSLAGDTTGLTYSVFAVAMESRSVSEFPSGWINGDITYVWLGRKNSDWNESLDYNWAGNNKPVNGENKIIRIIPEDVYSPEMTETVSVKKLSFEKDGASISLSGYKLSISECSAEDGCKLVINEGEFEYTGLSDYEIPVAVEISSSGKISSAQKLTLGKVEYISNPDITISGKILLSGGTIGKLTNETGSSVEFDSSLTVTGSAENNGNILLKDQGSFASLINRGILNLGTSAEFSGDVTNNGTINAGTGNLTFGGKYSAASGTLTGCTSANPEIYFSGDVTFGTFTHNNDPVFFAGSSVKTNGQEFKDCSFNGSGTASVEGMLKISGDLSIETGKSVSVSNDIHLAGNYINKGNFEASDGTFFVEGINEVSISGNNTFNNFTCVTSGITILFNADDTQTVKGKMKVIGEEESLIALDVIEKPGLQDDEENRWILNILPANLDFKYVTIKNSKSLQSIPFASPSINLKKDYYCFDGGNTEGWFADFTIYWYGKTDANWGTKSNWATSEDGTGVLGSSPSINDESLKVIIVKDETDEGAHTLVLSSNIVAESFEIEEGKSVNLAGFSVKADRIINNGNIILSGAAEPVLIKTHDDSVIEHSAEATVVFKDWTSNVPVKTTSHGLGFKRGFENLRIEGNRNFVFAEEEPDVVINGQFLSKASKNKASGNINLKSEYLLSANNEFIVGENSSMIFEGFVDSSEDGEYALKVSGNVEFKKEAGKNKKLSSLEVTGETKNHKKEIHTSGQQIYSGKMNLSGDTSFFCSSVTFGSDVLFSEEAESNEIRVNGNTIIESNDPADTVKIAISKLILGGNLSGTPLEIEGDLIIPASSVSNISAEIKILGSFINEGKCVVSKDDSSSGEISIYGNFLNSGLFSATSGSILLKGTEVNVLGNNAFYTLKIEEPGQKVYFQQGSKQKISGDFIVKGILENPVLLSSSVPGESWEIDFNTRSSNTVVLYTEIKDSYYSGTNGNATALYSKDSGNNRAWDFPGQHYAWTGNKDTDWDNKENWTPDSIPGKGASVVIPDNCSNYPVLTAALNLVYSDLNNGFVIKGEIENNGELDLSGYSLKVGSFINNQTLKLLGTESFDETETVSSGDASVIEYYGSAASTSPWVRKASAYKKLVVADNGVLTVNSALNANEIVNYGTLNVQSGNARILDELKNSGSVNISSGRTIEFAKYTGSGEEKESVTINGGTLKYTGNESSVLSSLITNISAVISGPVGEGKKLVIKKSELNVSDLILSGNIELPSGKAKTVIVSGGELSLSGDSFELQSLTINSDGKFISTSGTLTVNGNWENNNASGFTAKNGTVIFNGETISLKEAGQFNKIETSTGALILYSDLNVSESLAVNSNLAVTNGSYSCFLGKVYSVDSPNDLNFSGTGDLYFNKSVLNMADISIPGKVVLKENLECNKFDVSGSVEIEGGEEISDRVISASVSQNYNSDITVTGSCTFESPQVAIRNVSSDGNLRFDSKVLMKNPSTKIEATKTIFEGELAANTSGNKCSLAITGDVEFNKIVDVNGLEVLGNAVLNADIKASGNQKISGTVEIGNSITLSGKKVFLDGDIIKYNSDLNADEKYSLAVQASSSTLETPDVVFGGNVNGIENLTVTGVLKIEGNEINTSGNQTYNNDVIFDKDLRLTAEEKNIVFKKSLSGSKNLLVEAKEISFGASSNFKNLTLNSELAVANKIEITATENITLNGVSRLADTSFNCKNLSVNENINSGKLNVTVSDLFELSEGKDITLTGSFTQFGSGKNILSGSLISKNADVHFNSDVYLKGSSNLIFGTASTSDITKNYTFMGNLVIAMNFPETEINLNAPVTVKNLVLYRGALKNVNKITSENDIVLLGVDYSTDDGESGHEGEFKYNKTRKATYNYNGFDNGTIDCFPDSEKTALPLAGFYGGSVEYNSGAVIKAGKNFYANGVSLSGQGTWYLDILKNADPKICFAEAYNCNISNGVVRNASSKTEQPDLSSVMAEACIFDGENRNWDSEDFEIVRAYTVTDNVICVELSSEIRNLYGEFDSNIQNIYFNNNGTKESFRRILSSYELNPGQTGRADYVELTKESKLELRKFYLQTQNDSDSRWNTDATGLSSGNSVSTDSHGVSQSAVPSIFFERKLSGTDGNFTNRFGKILKVSGSYYTGTEDQTGPVLVEVAVGQETHTDYDPEKGAESQPSYDAHNFIEFRYSEPICLNQSGNNAEINVLPFTEEGEINFFENLKVTETFGKISSQGFTVAGLAAIQKGQLITGKVQEIAGVIDSTVHAFYRKPGMDPHSFRLSIAGYTEDVVKDNYEKEYKKWIGYIDSATVPQDKVTLPENGCSVIKDVAGNTFQSLKWEGLSVVNKSAYSELKDYGTWDISKPVFAVYRNAGIKWQNPEISGDYEAVGSTVDGTSSLKRIEFHMFDNKPLYNTSEAQWVSKKGWVRPFVPGPSADPDLYSADSYAADSVGGSRGFAAEERTTGGIRFCTIADASSAFKYAEVKPGETKIPDLDFSSDIRAYYGAASPIFQPGTNPARSPDKPDGLYFGYKLPSSVLSLKTQFAVSYDDQTGFVTDLAGNRLKSALIKTRDLTPPSFNMTVAPIGQKKIYIMFSKNLNVNTVTLNKQDGTPDNQSALNKALPEAFILATIESEDFTPSTGNQIDINVPARVLYSNESYMGLELTTTQDITYEDINKLYIVAKPLKGDYKDPIMDLKTLYATFIQDDAQNYMSARSAHILSDFAVNLIEPSYAYNEDLKSGDSNIQNGIFGDDSFAVHDWNAEQKNFGTLLQGGEIHIVSDVNDESLRSSENFYVRGYFDDSPDLKSVSEEYNKASGSKLRVWLPEVEGFRNFTALANKGNSEYKISDSKKIEDSDSFEFVIPETVAGKWKSGNQISFMFGLTDAAGNLLTRIHSPEYDYGIEKYVMPEPMPLFALRLKNPSDLTSLDLWSFRLKNTFLQKGNVSIFNNVIDSVKGEKTVLHIDNPSQGRVDVIVMTLDGNVVDYLNRGNLPQGVTELTWDGKNKNGKSVARGMYFIRIIGNGFDETRKVMVIKN